MLLPQYPYHHKNIGAGYLFSISKEQIYNYLNSVTKNPIEPELIELVADGMEKFNEWGSGYEAIAFCHDTVYCVLELMDFSETDAYLVKGIMDSVKKIIILDSSTLIKIPSGINLPNLSFETIIGNNKVIVIAESNGSNIEHKPSAVVFDKNLNYVGLLLFPNIEYRITDATSLDENNRFWAINYFYPGEYSELDPAPDSLVIRFGVGRSHLNSPVVERLLEFSLGKNGIRKTNTPPVYLPVKPGGDGRNWEGIARFEKEGFLVVTDRFPGSLLGYVALNSR